MNLSISFRIENKPSPYLAKSMLILSFLRISSYDYLNISLEILKSSRTVNNLVSNPVGFIPLSRQEYVDTLFLPNRVLWLLEYFTRNIVVISCVSSHDSLNISLEILSYSSHPLYNHLNISLEILKSSLTSRLVTF